MPEAAQTSAVHALPNFEGEPIVSDKQILRYMEYVLEAPVGPERKTRMEELRIPSTLFASWVRRIDDIEQGALRQIRTDIQVSGRTAESIQANALKIIALSCQSQRGIFNEETESSLVVIGDLTSGMASAVEGLLIEGPSRNLHEHNGANEGVSDSGPVQLTAEESHELASLQKYLSKSFPQPKRGAKRTILPLLKHYLVRACHLLLASKGNKAARELHLSLGVQGFQMSEWRKQFDPALPVVVESEHGQTDAVVSPAMLDGQIPVASSPLAPKRELPSWVRNTVRSTTSTFGEIEVERQRHELIRRQIGFVIEGDPVMEGRVWKELCLAAQGNGTVLIRGETGTGKELAYKTIRSLHAPNKVAIAVNCAGIAESLLESEFFGHVKGAFTGADRDREDGAFQVVAADGGTLFLDEIGDMPLSQQAKLLRVLQERQFSPVGSTSRVVELRNAKIVAASNRPLEELVLEGKFRQDLLQRLQKNTVYLPPLSERHDDHRIHLMGHFMNMRPNVSMHEDAFALFLHLPYPGNVRGFFDHLERAWKAAADGQKGEVLITAAHVESTKEQRSSVKVPQKDVDTPPSFVQQVDVNTSGAEELCKGALLVQVERQMGIIRLQINMTLLKEFGYGSDDIVEHIFRCMVLEAMKMTNGNQSSAAQILRVTRGKIRDRLNCMQSDGVCMGTTFITDTPD